MKLGYVVNRYPSVSHSFIRREIVALEALGATISRFSIRDGSGDLLNEADLAEAQRTRVVLSQGLGSLGLAALRLAFRRPAAFSRSIGSAWTMTRDGNRRLLRCIAYLLEASWLASQARRECLTHLHAHFGTNSTSVARLAANLASIGYSFTVHGPEEFDNIAGIDLVGKIKNAKFVVAISNYGRSQLVRFLGAAEWDKVKLVRCGVDLEQWQAASAEQPADYDLCYVGRLAAQKGLPTLLSALVASAREGRKLRTVICGDGELAAWVQLFCNQHDLLSHVEITGPASSETVRSLMQRSRFVIVPSFAEGLPVVIMEAFALERPVLSTYVAGIPELVDVSCGGLVPAGDVGALTALIALAQSWPDETRIALGRAGRRRVEGQHDIADTAAKLMELFHRASCEGRSLA